MTQKMKPIAWTKEQGDYAKIWESGNWRIDRYPDGAVTLDERGLVQPFGSVTSAMQAVADRVWGEGK